MSHSSSLSPSLYLSLYLFFNTHTHTQLAAYIRTHEEARRCAFVCHRQTVFSSRSPVLPKTSRVYTYMYELQYYYFKNSLLSYSLACVMRPLLCFRSSVWTNITYIHFNWWKRRHKTRYAVCASKTQLIELFNQSQVNLRHLWLCMWLIEHARKWTFHNKPLNVRKFLFFLKPSLNILRMILCCFHHIYQHL